MRFLLVTPIYTASRLTGGGQRTILLFRALRQLGKVDVALISEEVCRNFEENLAGFQDDFPEAEEISIIRSTPQFMFKPADSVALIHKIKYQIARLIHVLRPRSHFYRPSTDAKTLLDSLMTRNKYDAIVGRYLQATALSGALHQSRVPVMVDLDDLDEIVLTSRLRAQGTSRLRKPALRLQLWQTIPIVERLRDRCRHLFVSNSDDLSLIGRRPATILPNIPFPKAELQSFGEDFSSRTILFVGSFGHRVNREGVNRFARHCWPEIRRRVPDARFRIVGSGGWETAQEELSGIPGIEVAGKVDDLGIEYKKAALCISPIFEGAGTKIKILESLMYSRVVVAAAFSVRGFNESLLKGMVTVRSDEEMIDRCVFMIENPSIRSSISAESQRIVFKSYSFNSIVEAVKIAVDRMRLSPMIESSSPQ